MIKAIFGFLSVQIERLLGHTVELGEPSLCIAPERFDAVDMPFSIRKLIVSVMHPEMLVKAYIHQSVITPPAIGMDDGTRLHMPSYNGLQRSFGLVRHNLGIDLSLPLQQAEDHGLAVSPTSALAANALRAKVRFIDFYRCLQWRFQFTGLCQSLPHFKKNAVHGAQGHTRQLRRACGGKVQGKTANKLPEFGCADSRTAIVSVSNNHLSKLAYLNMCLTS